MCFGRVILGADVFLFVAVTVSDVSLQISVVEVDVRVLIRSRLSLP